MERLKIAIQKSGRLNDDSLKILKECGISVSNGLDQLRATVSNFPMEILYLRNSDIPQYLMDGVVDIAIIGENLLVEKDEGSIEVLERLSFSKCRISLAVPKIELVANCTVGHMAKLKPLRHKAGVTITR